MASPGQSLLLILSVLLNTVYNHYHYTVYQEDISVLLPLLHGVFPYWEQFGCHLPVSYDSIKGIQRGSGPHKGVKDKLTDVLHWYKRKSGPKKWNDVIKALKSIRNNDLASRVPQNGDG